MTGPTRAFAPFLSEACSAGGIQTLVLIGPLLGVQALSIFLLQPFWVLKQSADLLPDRRIRLIQA